MALENFLYSRTFRRGKFWLLLSLYAICLSVLGNMTCLVHLWTTSCYQDWCTFKEILCNIKCTAEEIGCAIITTSVYQVGILHAKGWHSNISCTSVFVLSQSKSQSVLVGQRSSIDLYSLYHDWYWYGELSEHNFAKKKMSFSKKIENY